MVLVQYVLLAFAFGYVLYEIYPVWAVWHRLKSHVSETETAELSASKSPLARAVGHTLSNVKSNTSRSAGHSTRTIEIELTAVLSRLRNVAGIFILTGLLVTLL